MIALLASIPSPDSGALHIGDLQLRMYGLMIALGVIAGVWLTGRRVEEKGIGTREDIQRIALWAVPAGVIGARLYHVITDFELFRHDLISMFKIWEGGLGIWGGVALGVFVGALLARRRGLPMWPTIDAAAPALALAQAIGRWGNWWNQELFGRPTDLPWGLEIGVSHRPPGYEQYPTFHPAFLYESLWNLGLCLVLLRIDKKHTLRPGRLFAMYVAGYTFARFWIERIRIDAANRILGLRVNEWVSAVIFLGSAGFLVIDWLRHRHEPPASPGGTSPADAEALSGEGEQAVATDELAISGGDGEPVVDTPAAAGETAGVQAVDAATAAADLDVAPRD